MTDASLNSGGKGGNPFPLQAPRGTRDILPGEQKYWEYVVETGKMVLRNWNFKRVDTPIFEETPLFTRAVGENTDIVSKELFELKTRGSGARYSLRPELTASMVRAYIENGLRSWAKPVKLYYVGPLFRYDRPQAGRWRQFHQLGMEVFGSDAYVTDVMIMYVMHVILRQLGLEEYTFCVNSLGAPNDRQEYVKTLKEYCRRSRHKLCRQCKERITSNPLRILDCKEEKCRQVANTAPKLFDYMSEEEKKHYQKVLDMLEALEVPHRKQQSLARGLDYYTGVVWEVLPDGDESASTSLAGGGRYDNLVKELGGRATPAVGGSLGIERAIDSLKEEGMELTVTDQPRVFVAQLGEMAKLAALGIMNELQEAGIHFAESVDREGMQPQLKIASRLGVRWVVIVGQKEVLDKTVILRNMDSGMQEVVAQGELCEELHKRLDVPG